MKLQDKVKNWINTKSYLPQVLVGLAGICYTIQVWIYSHNQESFLDEGFYLLKGYLFASGRYTPFQEYGTWTNKMPLSFLIPGYIQKVFGPGLYTGRTFAFSLSLLILIGAVMIGKRLGGKWGGALAAVLLTINPANLKIYSMVLSEVLIVFLIVMTLILVLGKDRPLWQILTGSFLTGIIPVTRINLFPVLPMVIIYLFWEHGYRKGIYGLLVSMIPFIGVNLIYWPEIIQLWAKWIPSGLLQSLDAWRLNFGDAIELHQPERTLLNRYLAFIEGIRFHFPAVMGVFTVICLWPKKWSDRSQHRSAVFLIALFFLLFLAHFGASILQNFNIYAFSVYLSFFDILGIFLVISTLVDWNYEPPFWKQWLIGLGIGFVCIGIAYTASGEKISYGIGIKKLLMRNALTFEDGNIGFASWRWWEVLNSRLGWHFSTSLKITGIVLFIFFVLIITVGISTLLNRLDRYNKDVPTKLSIPHILVVFLVIGILSSPMDILGGGRQLYDCRIGVIQTYDDAVDNISKFVEHGDQVFWIGSDTQPVLLGLVEEKDIQLFPQQLNSQYSFRLGGDADQLARAGFWNVQLAQEWINGSKVLLFEEQALSGWFNAIYPLIELGEFEKVGETSVIGCSAKQRILIYRRSQ